MKPHYLGMSKMSSLIGQKPGCDHWRIDRTLAVLVLDYHFDRLDLSRPDTLTVELFPDLDDQIRLVKGIPRHRSLPA